MAKQSAKSTIEQDVAIDHWSSFLAEFTRENRGAHARLEVLGNELGREVETENRPFEGIAADLKDGEHTIWISFASGPGDHHTHGVHKVTALRVRPGASRLGAALEVEAQDGTRTILELTRPEAFALPSAER